MKILLGVTGSIAAYKALELVRRLTQRGDEVEVALTAARGSSIRAKARSRRGGAASAAWRSSRTSSPRSTRSRAATSWVVDGSSTRGPRSSGSIRCAS